MKVIAKASPTVRDGMGLLGRTLQVSDRAKMADYLEQVGFTRATAVQHDTGYYHTVLYGMGY